MILSQLALISYLIDNVSFKLESLALILHDDFLDFRNPYMIIRTFPLYPCLKSKFNKRYFSFV